MKNKNKHNKQNKVTQEVTFPKINALQALKDFEESYAIECANRNIQQTDEGYCNYLRACFIYMNVENEVCDMDHEVISAYFDCVLTSHKAMEIVKEVEKDIGSFFCENGIKLSDKNLHHLWEALILVANRSRNARKVVVLDVLELFRALLYV